MIEETPQTPIIEAEPEKELFPRIGRRPEKRKAELEARFRKATRFKGRKKKDQDAAAKATRERGVIALKRELGRRLTAQEMKAL